VSAIEVIFIAPRALVLLIKSRLTCDNAENIQFITHTLACSRSRYELSAIIVQTKVCGISASFLMAPTIREERVKNTQTQSMHTHNFKQMEKKILGVKYLAMFDTRISAMKREHSVMWKMWDKKMRWNKHTHAIVLLLLMMKTTLKLCRAAIFSRSCSRHSFAKKKKLIKKFVYPPLKAFHFSRCAQIASHWKRRTLCMLNLALNRKANENFSLLARHLKSKDEEELVLKMKNVMRARARRVGLRASFAVSLKLDVCQPHFCSSLSRRLVFVGF
jgi:hypothetical protein